MQEQNRADQATETFLFPVLCFFLVSPGCFQGHILHKKKSLNRQPESRKFAE